MRAKIVDSKPNVKKTTFFNCFAASFIFFNNCNLGVCVWAFENFLALLRCDVRKKGKKGDAAKKDSRNAYFFSFLFDANKYVRLWVCKLGLFLKRRCNVLTTIFLCKKNPVFFHFTHLDRSYKDRCHEQKKSLGMKKNKGGKFWWWWVFEGSRGGTSTTSVYYERGRSPVAFFPTYVQCNNYIYQARHT